MYYCQCTIRPAGRAQAQMGLDALDRGGLFQSGDTWAWPFWTGLRCRSGRFPNHQLIQSEPLPNLPESGRLIFYFSDSETRERVGAVSYRWEQSVSKKTRNADSTTFLVLCKQITGIEPASPAWEASILPMNYICIMVV